MAKTNSQKQREMRQEQLRELLKNKGLIQQVIVNIDKMDELDPTSEYFSNEIKKLETSNNQRMALVRKFLPDVKSIELTGESGKPVEVKAWNIVGIPADGD